jgi:predicted DNA repair protein MutK
MAVSLLALIDDISSVLDDVALLTKVAAKKTAGVVGDDLAVNAHQLHGTSPEKELPIIWAVCKGSFKNKLLLLPLALLLSYFLPALITPVLMIGGSYLSFEGVEKILEKLFPHPHDIKPVASEAEKIKGAIRTDLVLSAEIMVIALGMVKNGSFLSQIISLSAIALIMTIGVYGVVALIIKLDDMGLYLLQHTKHKIGQKVGSLLLHAAPKLMKFLGVAGTLAMFTVGGGIIAHGVPFLHHLQEITQQWRPGINWVAGIGLEIIIGIGTGLLVVGLVKTLKLIKTWTHPSNS